MSNLFRRRPDTHFRPALQLLDTRDVPSVAPLPADVPAPLVVPAVVGKVFGTAVTEPATQVTASSGATPQAEAPSLVLSLIRDDSGDGFLVSGESFTVTGRAAPGQTVTVSATWRNTGGVNYSATGTAADSVSVVADGAGNWTARMTASSTGFTSTSQDGRELVVQARGSPADATDGPTFEVRFRQATHTDPYTGTVTSGYRVHSLSDNGGTLTDGRKLVAPKRDTGIVSGPAPVVEPGQPTGDGKVSPPADVKRTTPSVVEFDPVTGVYHGVQVG